MDQAENKQTANEPVVVKNRDIIPLGRVLFVMQDVCKTEELRNHIQDRMWHMTQNLTGMPSAHGTNRGIDDLLADAEDIEGEYREDCGTYLDELKAAEEILNGIKNPNMRTFVIMKYVFDMPDARIMRELNMGRKRFERACRDIEQAEDMAHAAWRERYVMG